MKLIKFLKAKSPKIVKFFFKYMLGISAFDHISIMRDGLQGTIINLQNKYPFFKPVLVRFLIDFYSYLLQLELNLPLYRENNFLIIHCCCWGQSYTNKMTACFLPSLLAKNNLSKISEKFKTMLLIHCDQFTKEIIINSPIAAEIEKYAELNFIILPQNFLSIYQSRFNQLEFFLLKKLNLADCYKYFLLGGLQTHAFQIALKNKAYISFMMPDVILSDSFFLEILSEIQSKKVVLSTTFRTHYQQCLKKVIQFYDSSLRKKLSISSAVLTELQIENMHKAAKRRIVSKSTINFTPSGQLIFEAEHGYIIRAFHYHPVLINCDKIKNNIRMDYFPIDNSILNQIVSEEFSFEEQLYVFNDRTKIAWVELSDDDVEEVHFESQSTSYSELIKKVKEMIIKQPSLFDTPLNRYFFSLRNKVYSTQTIHSKVDINDHQFALELIGTNIEK